MAISEIICSIFLLVVIWYTVLMFWSAKDAINPRVKANKQKCSSCSETFEVNELMRKETEKGTPIYLCEECNSNQEVCFMCSSCVPNDKTSKQKIANKTHPVCFDCYERLRYSDKTFNEQTQIQRQREKIEAPQVLDVAPSYSKKSERSIVTISRIKDASTCPYKYYKGYIEEPKADLPFESIEAGMGQFFHSYLEDHFKQIKAKKRAISKSDRINVDDLINNFRLSFLWEGKLRSPYKIVKSGQDFDDFSDRLYTVGKNFNKFLSSKLIRHKVEAIEGKLQIRTKNCYIRGRYDLITKRRGEEYVLWDWKTGRVPSAQFFKEFRDQKVQLGIYAIWLKHFYDTSNVRGTAVFLRDKYESLSEVFKPEIEKEVLVFVENWRRNMNAVDSYPPIPNRLCDWCGWKPMCPEHQQTFVEIIM